MERLLEKLKCRTIMVEDGAEAMRLAMGEVKCSIFSRSVHLRTC